MEEKPQTVSLRYYGISPWEIEVIYNIFNEKFEVIQEDPGKDGYFTKLGWNTDNEFVSAITITIPLPFSEEFFKWFEFREWDKVKHIIKEMKRRRGNRKAILVQILFGCWVDGQMSIPDYPTVQFVIDSNENHNFNSAVEKIEFVVELFPYHLNDSNIPNDPTRVLYKYDIESGKWKLNQVWTGFDGSVGQKKFVLTKNRWNLVT